MPTFGSATSGSVPGYLNYLGTEDPTIRAQNPAEVAAAAAAERDRLARLDAQAAAALAARQRQADINRQDQAAKLARGDALSAQAAEARRLAQARQDALDAAALQRSQLEADRTHAESLLGIGGAGSMAALGGVATGGGGGAIPGGTFTGGGAASGTFSAPVLQTAMIDPAEEAAAKTAAKESAGLRLQSSMKGLQQAMSGRGIKGSGIEAQGMADLFGASASDEATAGRERAAANAARTREVGNLNQAASNQWATANLQANANMAMSAADRAAATDNQLRSLLWNYAMRY